MNGTISRRADAINFFPLDERELNRNAQQHPHMGGNVMAQMGLSPQHKTYACGACGGTTNGRVLCNFKRQSDGAFVMWCLCSCDKHEPTIIIKDGDNVISQLPNAREFHSASDWPADLASLYDEAAKAHAAGAYTASTMVCRKLLMACACNKGETDGKAFTDYVDHITGKVLAYPAAKSSIDAIRTIGNEATHEVKIVNQADATRALKIVTYMLNTIYSLPAA